MYRSNIPANLQDETTVIWEEDYNGFGGPWEGSRKRLDFAIQVRNADGEDDIKFVLEVGLSEPCDQLVKDARLWLEGTQEVSMVSPIYKVSYYNCANSINPNR